MCGIWGIFGSEENVQEHCKASFQISKRGPDAFRFENINHFPNCALGFHWLAIVDDNNGMQPIRNPTLPHIWMTYNGEIYNYKDLQAKHSFTPSTDSDGECLIHLYNKGGIQFMCEQLYGVFGFILFDTKRKEVYVGRDTFGVRPAFKLLTETGTLAVCSEAKGLNDLKMKNRNNAMIEIVEPGTYEKFELYLPDDDSTTAKNKTDYRVKLVEKKRFHEITATPKYDVAVSIKNDDMYENIRNILTNAVKVRLMAQRRMGCFLSGGLDSSLTTGLMVNEARKAGITYPIQTFSIGMGENSPDVLAARKVAAYLKTEHHEVIFTPEEAIACIPDVIRTLEVYDITTIRSSIPMFLINKYVSEKTDTIVVFTGEGADEICQGYTYFYEAPSPEATREESLRIAKDLHLFDVARADRCVAGHGLEIRVPFLDHFFASYVYSLPPDQVHPMKERREKHLIREAFSGTGIIPNEILWRPKEAFSDGVASKKKSLSEHLSEHVSGKVSDEAFATAHAKHPFNTPLTKEAFFYRELFTEMYPNCEQLTPYMWLPRWCGDVTDPSARKLNAYKDQQGPDTSSA